MEREKTSAWAALKMCLLVMPATRQKYEEGRSRWDRSLQAKRSAKLDRSHKLTFREAAEATHREQNGAWRNSKHRAQWLSAGGICVSCYRASAGGRRRRTSGQGPPCRYLAIEAETARRVRQRIGSVLDWAYAKGLRASEAPTRSISKGLPRPAQEGQSFLCPSISDAPALMAKLESSSTVGRLALRFLILTAARSGEVRLASWKEVDLNAGSGLFPQRE
jgi:integrase